ncbi:hypothetical protein ACSSS7_000726 [Eimeria intestinalis]
MSFRCAMKISHLHSPSIRIFHIDLLLAADQPLAAPVAFASTEEKLPENECCVGGSKKGEAVRARRVLALVKTWAPVVLSLVLLSLLAPLCYDRKFSAVTKGVRSRRLAGRGNTDDDDWSDYAYLESICAALGAWTPSEGSPEVSRASTAIMDEVLATLEEGVEDSSSLEVLGTGDAALVYEDLSGFVSSLPAPAGAEPQPFSSEKKVDVAWPAFDVGAAPFLPSHSSGEAKAFHREQSGAKRYRPEDAGEEEPRSSWKITKLDWRLEERLAQQAVAAQQPGWEPFPLAEQGDTGRGGIFFTDPLPVGVPEDKGPAPSYYSEPPSSFGPAPPSQTQPSAATSPTPETSTHGWEGKHAFVRIPRIAPGVVPRPLNVRAIYDEPGPLRHVWLLRRVRQVLLSGPLLSQEKVDVLVSLVEQLASHLNRVKVVDLSKITPYNATNVVGRLFLLYEAMSSISLALKVDWSNEPWWKHLADRVFPNVDTRKYGKNAYPFFVDLLSDMSNALKMFMSGVRPSEKMILSIKQRLLCSDSTTHHFRKTAWDDWRKDAENC